MTDRERNLLALRYVEIHAELEALKEGRVVDGDPAQVEWELLGELEEIEFSLGSDYFDRRGSENPG